MLLTFSRSIWSLLLYFFYLFLYLLILSSSNHISLPHSFSSSLTLFPLLALSFPYSVAPFSPSLTYVSVQHYSISLHPIHPLNTTGIPYPSLIYTGYAFIHISYYVYASMYIYIYIYDAHTIRAINKLSFIHPYKYHTYTTHIP